MRRRNSMPATALLALAGVANTSQAQPELIERMNLQQDATIGRLVADLSAPSLERRRFALWSLETLLVPGGSDGPIFGLERAVGSGLLTQLDGLVKTDDAALADDARRVLAIVDTQLSLGRAEASAARIPDLGTNERQSGFVLGEWLRFDTVPGQEYSVESGDCALVGVVALGEDGRSGVAGGTTVGGQWTFVPDAAGQVLLRAAADECDGAFAIVRRSPPIDLPAVSSASRPAAIEPGQRYRGHFRPNADQWLRIDLEAGPRYRFELEPGNGVDTMLTIYEADGFTEIARDDDGGNGLGSRIDLVRNDAGPLLINASELGGSAGEFRVLVTETEPPLDLARPIRTGDRVQSQFDASGENWWRLDVEAGARYEISAHPEGGVDTFLALFSADGLEPIAENDDAGDGLGSRLTYGSPDDGVLLIRVTEFGGGSGRFRLDVDEWRIEDLGVRDVEIGRATRGLLAQNAPDWWRIETAPGQRYRIDVEPADGIDTKITLYDETGANELDSDDDGGEGLGSRLDFTSSGAGPMLVRVEELGGEAGPYTLHVEQRQRPSDLADTLRPGRAVQAVIGYGGESWWQFRGEAGVRYTIEATPRSSIDTQMTLYRGDALEQIAFDDDGGEDLGSRIEYAATADEMLYVLIGEFDGQPGEFVLSLTAR